MWTKDRKFSARVLSVLLSLILIFGLIPVTASAEDTATYFIGITSDVHDKTQDLQTWLTNLGGTTDELDHMIFGGDYTYTGDAATVSATCSSITTSTYSGAAVVLARGNHDTTGTYANGLVYNGSDYAIYGLDLDTSSQTISMDKIEALDTALAAIDLTKPVFVVSHYPLHYYSSRTTINAEELVERLNDYPNVIFLWGHNHSLSDPAYGTVKQDGDTIQCASGSSPVTIHFTYANMGSIYAGTNNAYGVLVTLTAGSGDTTVDFKYKNLSGSTTSSYSIDIDSTLLAEKPKIDSQPQDVTVNIGEDAILSVGASVTDGGSLSYQWYQNDSDSNTGGTAVGTDSYTYAASTVAAGTQYYYCKVTNTKDGDTAWTSSEAAKVKVNAGDTGITYEYADTIESGCTYVIVSKGSTNYAITTEAYSNYLLGDEVTVTGDEVDAGDITEDMLWTFATDGSGYNVKNGSNFLTRTSGGTGVKIQTTDAGAAYTDWEYDSGNHYLRVYSSNASQYYYLYQTSGSGNVYFNASSTTNGTIYLYKQVVANVTPIDSVVVTGIDAPVAGATPDTSALVTTTGVMTPAITWDPNNSTFKYDTVYTVNITLSAQSAYEFTSGTTVTVNGAPATSVTLNGDGTLLVTYTFEKTGASPQFTYEYADSIESGCTYVIVSKGSTNYAITTQAYSDYLLGDEVTVTGDEVDAGDVTEDMLWTFTTDGSGYNVKNGSNFLTRISGGGTGVKIQTTDAGAAYTDWEYDSSNHYLRVYSSNASRYYYLYQTSDSDNDYFAVSSTTYGTIYLYKQTQVTSTAIDAAAVTGIDTPVAGATPDTSANAITAGVTVSTVTWVPADDPFGFGTIYTASVTLTAQSGYVLEEDATVTINGQVAQVTPNLDGTLTASYSFNATQSATDAETPQITGEPQDVTVTEGGTAELSVTAAVSVGTLSYQWYSNTTDSNTDGTLIAGVEDDTYSAPTDTAGIVYYYCVVTNTDTAATGNQTAQAVSETAKVTVNALADAETPQITGEPQDVTVTEDGVAELSVTAAASVGTLSYQWYSNTTDSNTDGTLIAGAEDDTYSAPTDTAGIVYYYCVVTNTDTAATGNQTAQAVSETAKVTVNALADAETPQITGEPQDVTVTEGGTAELSVTAAVSVGTLSYQWYSNTTDSNTDGTLIAGAEDDTYSAPTDTAGIVYYYCVVTNTDTAATGNQTAQAVSETAKVTVQLQEYVITASPNNDAYGKVTGDGTYVPGMSVSLRATPKSGYRFVRWMQGTTQVSESDIYTFTVTGNADFVAEFASIDAPTIYAKSAGYDSIRVSWNAVTGAAGYEIWRSLSADGVYVKVGTASDISFTDTGLTFNRTYYYKVKAYCATSVVTTYGSLSAYASAAPTLSVTVATATMKNYNSITVSWNAVDHASGYQLYRATSPDGKFSLIRTTSALSYTNGSLKTGTTYYYKVRAYIKTGGTKIYGDYSAVTSATPVLTSVSGVTATAYSPTGVKIAWHSVSGRSGYEVWRSTSENGTYTLIKSTSDTSYKNSGLTPFVSYYYKVRAYRTVSGKRVYSDFCAADSVTPILGTVTGTKAVMKSTSSIRISWSAVSGRSGYEIWRAASETGEYTLVKSTSKTSYTNTSLVPNITYYYKVRAYVTVSGTRVYSDFSSLASAMPVFASVANAKAVRRSATSIKLTWGSVSGRSGYEVWRATSADGEYTLIRSTTSTSYTNTRLLTGTTYYYKIRAYKTIGGVRYYSDFSEVVSATP